MFVNPVGHFINNSGASIRNSYRKSGSREARKFHCLIGSIGQIG